MTQEEIIKEIGIKPFRLDEEFSMLIYKSKSNVPIAIFYWDDDWRITTRLVDRTASFPYNINEFKRIMEL